MRWGLIPAWAKDMTIGTRTLNARSETVTKTPAFRDSILTKRCLVPTDGFYEWRQLGSVKQPYCFEVGEGEVFALAGLWDRWKSPSGEIIESCTILTMELSVVVFGSAIVWGLTLLGYCAYSLAGTVRRDSRHS
jgi:putative SOS response-associated peptidase YedK